MIDRLKYIVLAGAIGAALGGLVAAAVRNPAEPFPAVIVVGFACIFAVCGAIGGRRWGEWVVDFFLNVWK